MQYDGKYLIALSDGYIRQPREGWCANRARTAPSLEQAMAEHLQRLATYRHLSNSERRHLRKEGFIAEHAHVWVVGAPGWLKSANPDVKQLVGAETDSAYRIAIAGLNLGFDGELWSADLPKWLSRTRMYKQRRSESQATFDAHWCGLLKAMQQSYGMIRGPPTRVLTDLEVPVAYAGG